MQKECAKQHMNLTIEFFGVPSILQSDNGREFRNMVVQALTAMWPDMKFVHGRARHPQSQGSTERANADVKKMLATWMRDNNSLKWSIGCHRWAYNRRLYQEKNGQN